MDTSVKKQINFCFSILPKATVKAFNFLSNQDWMADTKWYLAGGTALALQAGHRKSVDLDFFTELKEFINEDLLFNFIGNADWVTDINRKNTIYGRLFKAKVSFIAYPFFTPKLEMSRYGTINILQPRDIAVMKLIAISQRGRKRDFFDLYWCAKNVEPLKNLIKRLKAQYPSVAHDYYHILKSLVYFADAEGDPLPEIYFKSSWQEVKFFFTKEVPMITADLIKLR